MDRAALAQPRRTFNPAPHGYRWDNEGELVLDQERAPFVLGAFERYLELRASDPLTAIDVLAAELAEEGFTTRKGEPFTRDAAIKMLRSVVYVGRAPARGRAPRERLIGEDRETELFDAVQAALDEDLQAGRDKREKDARDARPSDSHSRKKEAERQARYLAKPEKRKNRNTTAKARRQRRREEDPAYAAAEAENLSQLAERGEVPGAGSERSGRWQKRQREIADEWRPKLETAPTWAREAVERVDGWNLAAKEKARATRNAAARVDELERELEKAKTAAAADPVTKLASTLERLVEGRSPAITIPVAASTGRRSTRPTIGPESVLDVDDQDRLTLDGELVVGNPKGDGQPLQFRLSNGEGLTLAAMAIDGAPPESMNTDRRTNALLQIKAAFGGSPIEGRGRKARLVVALKVGDRLRAAYAVRLQVRG